MPDNTSTAEAKATTSTLRVTGDPDVWRLICKASAPTWMKSTKAMQTSAGVIVQVSTEHRDGSMVTACAEALALIPGAELVETPDGIEIQ